MSVIQAKPRQPCQSLFVAPCYHTWHYKCIRVILNGPQWPQFLCPNCRAVVDLEADVEPSYPDGDWEDVSPADNNKPEPPLPAPTTATPETRDSEPRHLLDQSIIEPVTNDHTLTSMIHGVTLTPPAPTVSSISDSSDPESTEHAGARPIPASRNASYGTGSSRRRSASAAGLDDGLDSGLGQDVLRTPSPHLPVTSADVVSPEGPMTPRNDAGPFVFDGSAGRASGLRLGRALALDEAASTPPL